MSYKCETCDHNNNGWCKENKMNGLKKQNIQECYAYSKTKVDTEVLFGKESEDKVTIKINNETVTLPIAILKDFIDDHTANVITMNIQN